MKILWLASWYPSRLEPYNGDFVQRHAEAASLYHDIVLFHVIKDPERKVTNDVAVEVHHKGRLTEHIIYYHSPFMGVPLLEPLFSELKYRRVFKRHVKTYLAKNGRPELVHLHVCMKAGVIALWMKKKYKLPYVVTEHATQFLHEDPNSIYRKPFYYRRTCQRVLRQAKAITAVSGYLGKALQAFSGRAYSVLPNVVNTDVFSPVQKRGNDVRRFVHISGLSYQKNLEDILKAIRLLANNHHGFVLDVVGPANASLLQTVAAWNLTNVVRFHNEMPQPALANLLREADALILFSRYETFGCVLIEANACGVPVAVNDLAVMHEIVKTGFNGLVVQNTPEALAEALKRFVDGTVSFSSEEIANDTSARFGYATIGKAFAQLYAESVEAS